MSFKVFLTGSGIAEKAQHLLRDEGCVIELGDPKDSPEELENKLRNFNPDAIIVRQGKITKAVQEAASNLKVICKHGVGTDNIDLEAASKRGIPVLCTRKANFESVAEHTLALMLSMIRRIPLQDKLVHAGIFNKISYNGLELFGKKIGIIGYGSVGKRFAELLAPFHVRVIVYDPYDKTEVILPYIERVDQLEDLCKCVNIISLHCPLTKETRNMISESIISKMKPGVFVINTARGGIINETDLIKALNENRILGAALDVLEKEPPDPDHPLIKMDNVIFSPHISGMSDNSFENMGIQSVQYVLGVLRGQMFDINSVDNKDILHNIIGNNDFCVPAD